MIRIRITFARIKRKSSATFTRTLNFCRIDVNCEDGLYILTRVMLIYRILFNCNILALKNYNFNTDKCNVIYNNLY